VIAEVQMCIGGRMLADSEIDGAAQRIGYRCRDQVNGATGGSGADHDSYRALEYFECVHAALCRKVISRRGSVGRWCDQDDVFEERNAAGAKRPCPGRSKTAPRPMGLIWASWANPCAWPPRVARFLHRST